MLPFFPAMFPEEHPKPTPLLKKNKKVQQNCNKIQYYAKQCINFVADITPGIPAVRVVEQNQNVHDTPGSSHVSVLL